MSTKGSVFWMRDWPIPWHLESLVYRELFASMSLQARSGLRYIHSFIYSRFGEPDWASKRAIKYDNVPRKKRKKRAFLENHLLEFHEIWQENTLGNKLLECCMHANCLKNLATRFFANKEN